MSSQRNPPFGIGGQSFKFSELRDSTSEDILGAERISTSLTSSPPSRAAGAPAAAPKPATSYDDFLDRLPPPPPPPPPSAHSRPRYTPRMPPQSQQQQPPPSATSSSASLTKSSTPPPPAVQPASSAALLPSTTSAPSALPPLATVSAKPSVQQQDAELDADDDDEFQEADEDSAPLPLEELPWPFPDQAEDGTDPTTNHRVIRTDDPPPNPLTRKFPLLFALLTAALSIACSAPLPLPDLAKGLVIGCSMSCCLLVYFYLEFLANRPVVIHYTGAKYCRNPRANVQAFMTSSSSSSAADRRSKRLDGFLNESWSYEVERHHLNQTFTVYAALEGSRLTLRRPQHLQVPKRVLHSDDPINVDAMTFSDSRQFDLLNAKLRLVPQGLVRKRLWSKKYPIHVALLDPAPLPASAAASSAAASSTFEEVKASDCVQRELYLFARTSRDKELWFRRLYAASNGLPQPESLYKLALDTSSSGASAAAAASASSRLGDQAKRCAEYVASFGRFADISEVQLGSADKPELNFLNAMLLRATWDVFKTPYWADVIKTKIDARLKKIRLPYFIEELSVAEVNVGSAIPVLRRLHKPHVNDRGIWFHLDIDYPGGCSASLVTRINLTRLQERGAAAASTGAAGIGDDVSAGGGSAKSVAHSSSADSYLFNAAGACPFTDSPVHQRSTAATNADVEDSGESTTDESGQSDPEPDADDPALGNVGGKHSKRVIKFIDKVAHSEKFHSLLGKYKFLQKAVNSVSNTKILLSVDVHSLRGSLVLNMPFPPSDRVWAAFHPVPQLALTSRPKIGEKEFSARKISDLISKKLIAEFHRVMVLPNMEDFYLPTLNSDEALLAAAAAGGPADAS